MPPNSKKSIPASTSLNEAEKRTRTVTDEVNGTVYMEKGFTKNMGDYNSTRVTIGITLPINPTVQQINEVQKTIIIGNDILDAELEEQLKNLNA